MRVERFGAVSHRSVTDRVCGDGSCVMPAGGWLVGGVAPVDWLVRIQLLGLLSLAQGLLSDLVSYVWGCWCRHVLSAEGVVCFL